MRVVDEDRLGAALASIAGDEPRVVVAGNAATPHRLLAAADRHLERVRLFVLNPQGAWPERDGVVVETPFVGGGCRGLAATEYLPMRLSLVPSLFSGLRPPDAVLVQASPPRRGRVSLGVEVTILPAAIEAVRRRGGLVVAQVNREMPYTHGDAELELDAVDLAVEADEPLGALAPSVADDAAESIARHAAEYVQDHGTLQCGIGRAPDAVARRLASARGLKIWSEVVSDGVLGLERAGALDADHPIRCSFLLGSPELYAWADGNERLRLERTETINDPTKIARQPGMSAVNAALQADLFDQVNATYVGGRVYSGFGGQPDFVVGALHAPGGRVVVVLHAWHAATDRSAVVPLLDVPATSFQHTVLVTEHGAAELLGRSQREQATALIERAADPRARAWLREAADELAVTAPA